MSVHTHTHTRAYLQQARARWKSKILMRFITYKPLTTGGGEKKHDEDATRCTDKSPHLPACWACYHESNPASYIIYLQIIWVLFKEKKIKRRERVKPSASAFNQDHRWGEGKKRNISMLLRSFSSVARRRGTVEEAALQRGFSRGRGMGFQEWRWKPRPSLPEPGGRCFCRRDFSPSPPAHLSIPAEVSPSIPSPLNRISDERKGKYNSTKRPYPDLSRSLFIAGTVLGVRVPHGNFDWRRPNRSGRDRSPPLFPAPRQAGSHPRRGPKQGGRFPTGPPRLRRAVGSDCPRRWGGPGWGWGEPPVRPARPRRPYLCCRWRRNPAS